MFGLIISSSNLLTIAMGCDTLFMFAIIILTLYEGAELNEKFE